MFQKCPNGRSKLDFKRDREAKDNQSLGVWLRELGGQWGYLLREEELEELINRTRNGSV